MRLLYHLQPIGVGSEHVESFTSYMYRLAAAHNTSLGQMIDWLQEADAEEKQPIVDVSTATSAVPWAPYAMVRPIETARNLVAQVERHTRCENLRCTTFLALHELSHRSVGLFANELRWCSSCWSEDVDQGDTAYFRLYWSLLEVKVCSVHGVPLQRRCPRCHHSVGGMDARDALHLCPTCGGSMITSRSCFHLPKDLRSRLQCPDLIELVSVISADPALEYDPNTVRRFLQEVVADIAKREEDREFWRDEHRKEAIKRIRGKKTIPFKTLRRMAYWLGADLPGLLAGDVRCLTRQLDPQWLSSLPPALKPPKRQRVDRTLLAAKLAVVLADMDPNRPLPLSRVARSVGVSTGGLRYLHPEVVKKVVADHRAWKEAELVRKCAEARVGARNYLQSDRQPKTRTAALEALLAQSGDLSWQILKKMVDVEFDEMELGKSPSTPPQQQP